MQFEIGQVWVASGRTIRIHAVEGEIVSYSIDGELGPTHTRSVEGFDLWVKRVKAKFSTDAATNTDPGGSGRD